MQAAELHHDEKQEEAVGPRRVQEILSSLREAHAAQGDEIIRYVSSLIGRAAVSKTAGWGFESLLTCDSLPVSEGDYRHAT